MNIQQAKEQIKNTVTTYLTRDAYGSYVLPVSQQRPVFLMGPPGIGKTAIMEQISQELGIGLVSYSMTHHTRQSALGLPFIEKKIYNGKEYSVSEYTMSEIIAAIYDKIEQTGRTEGILFLDEINCVSETLAPVMLQFLQYKVFGRHTVPEGWIIVTAGNPPEYNNSVREFDIVTWDRLKRIDIEPDFDAWKVYASTTHAHPAVLTYLEIKRQNFYKIESTVDGKRFVTARGWSDLSTILKLYELHNLTVDENLVRQYLQNAHIAKDFAIYYDLFLKYRGDYQIDTILAGKASQEIRDRAKKAAFDERYSLLGLLVDALNAQTQSVIEEEQLIQRLPSLILNLKNQLGAPGADPADVLQRVTNDFSVQIATGKSNGILSESDIRLLHRQMDALQELGSAVLAAPADRMKLLKSGLDKRIRAFKKLPAQVSTQIDNVFHFLDEVFGEGQENLILVTELTMNPHTSHFLGTYGSKAYFTHNKDLLFYQRQTELIDKIDTLTAALDQ